ncbi:MAG: 2,3-diphosphoglycerate-dependent phosphoglycerate mutase [Bdellovibrionaceae bacterium]|nr:2,3-diphosphoglycerate-dependent phosphoglycerate mutase [Bdellovibrio sp.]
MYTLVVVRHGESTWNKENRFTGWKDVDLSEKGISEAQKAGKALVQQKLTFDFAYTSRLTRAIRTLNYILDEMKLQWVPVTKEWRLNERHYGGLQGLNKAETAEKHGEQQVKIWRRSFDTPPPPMETSHPDHPSHDVRYNDVEAKDLPNGESLKDTIARFLPLWEQKIAKDILAGKKILIAAHGNSLRALIKLLEGQSAEEIMAVNVPTGIPLVYQLEKDPSTPSGFKVLKKEFLADAESVAAAMAHVADQGKKI